MRTRKEAVIQHLMPATHTNVFYRTSIFYSTHDYKDSRFSVKRKRNQSISFPTWQHRSFLISSRGLFSTAGVIAAAFFAAGLFLLLAAVFFGVAALTTSGFLAAVFLAAGFRQHTPSAVALRIVICGRARSDYLYSHCYRKIY